MSLSFLLISSILNCQFLLPISLKMDDLFAPHHSDLINHKNSCHVYQILLWLVIWYEPVGSILLQFAHISSRSRVHCSCLQEDV
jgi:hypothetical protein